MTVTETFTVTGGVQSDAITATTSFAWSKAVSSTDTYTFNLADGDDGHIEFLPNVNQICGDLTSYGYVCFHRATASMHHHQRLLADWTYLDADIHLSVLFRSAVAMSRPTIAMLAALLLLPSMMGRLGS